MRSKRKKVALLIEASNSYARGLLSGIIAFEQRYSAWSIYLPEHQRRGVIPLGRLKDWEVDGILARIETDMIAGLIRSLNVPTVDLSAARLIPGIPWVETDNRAIAELAANNYSNQDSTISGSWVTGDFNGDGDVDVNQFDPITFTNVGDLTVLYSNLGRNVRPPSGRKGGGLGKGGGSSSSGSSGADSTPLGLVSKRDASSNSGMLSRPANLVADRPKLQERKPNNLETAVVPESMSVASLAGADKQTSPRISTKFSTGTLDGMFASYAVSDSVEIESDLTVMQDSLVTKLGLKVRR